MMKFGTTYKQGDIVIVPFPFSDLSSIKQRPVLILSKSEDIKQNEEIITCGITSNLQNMRNSVIIDNSNLQTGKIPIKSRIKIDKLFTLDKKIIIKKVASLRSESFERVRHEFQKLI